MCDKDCNAEILLGVIKCNIYRLYMKIIGINVRFEVLMAMKIQAKVFLDVVPRIT
jgi:hypothetical protein